MTNFSYSAILLEYFPPMHSSECKDGSIGQSTKSCFDAQSSRSTQNPQALYSPTTTLSSNRSSDVGDDYDLKTVCKTESPMESGESLKADFQNGESQIIALFVLRQGRLIRLLQK
jgi:hypothetical protein